MIKNYEVKTLKLNTPLRGKPAGSIVRIRFDKNGVALDKYWRNRLEDAKIDKCVEIVRKEVATKRTRKKTQENKGD